MNSVNSLLWREEEDNGEEKGQTDQASWSGWLPPILRNDPQQNLKRLDLFSATLARAGGAANSIEDGEQLPNFIKP